MPNAGFVSIVEPSEEAQAEIGFRCGHGCVRCGVTVHLFAAVVKPGASPPPDSAVAMLCPGCFALFRSRPISEVQFAAIAYRPVARDPRFDRSHLPYHHNLPDIVAGGMSPVRGTSIPLLINGHPPLAIVPPMSSYGATRLDVRLSDAQGELCHVVRANRWFGSPGDWTFERRGDQYIVSSLQGSSRLEVEFNSQDRMTIHMLRTQIEGKQIELTPRWLEIDGARLTGVIASNRVVGFEL